MKLSRVIFVLTIIYVGCLTASAGVPQLINFQGQLRDNAGSPLVNDTLAVEFKLYDDAVSGNVKWSEIDTVITDASGLFTILLGKNNPVPDTTFNDSLRWLGIKVGSDPEISPRSQISSAGYSYVSSQWTSAGQDIFRLGGKVGIGTNSPLVNLHLQSIPSVNLLLDNSGTLNRWNIGVAAGNNNAIGFTYGSATRAYFQTNGDIWFGVTGGNVGIGTSAPVSALDVNGQISAAPGNMAAPAFTFEGDLNTGMFRISDDNLGLATGGLERVRVNPGGNVGIGVLTPLNKLDLEGGAAFGASYAGSNFAPSNGLLVEGSVGIGTNSPTTKLEVAATGRAILGVASNSGAEDVAVEGRASGSSGELVGLLGTATGSGGVGLGVLGRSTTGGVNYGVYGSAFGGTTNWAGYFPNGNVFILENVGIGTQIPASKLHVQNGNTATSFDGTLGSVSEAASNGSETKYGSYGVGSGTQGSKIGVAGLAKGSGTMGVGVSGEAFVASAVNWGLFGQAAGSGSENYGVYATASGGTINWAGAFAGNVQITGQVGIGTASPSAKLHVKGAGFPNSFGYFDTDATNQDAGLRFQEAGVVKSHLYYAAGTNTLNLYGEGFSGISVTSTGGVGIGTTAPAALLHVNGTAGNNTGVWSNLSDLRLKRDIEPIEGALETVERLKGITFRWKDDQKDAQFGRVRGLIAQDVEKVIPEWIKTDPDGYKRLEPIGIDALLIEAIKEQQKQIEELQAEIAKLKTQPYQAQVEN